MKEEPKIANQKTDSHQQILKNQNKRKKKSKLLAVKKKKILKKRFPGRENISKREALTKKLEEIFDVGFATNQDTIQTIVQKKNNKVKTVVLKYVPITRE